MAEDAANVNVTSALPDDIRESLAVSNIKTIAEAGAFFMARGFADATAHANRLNILAETAMAQAVKGLQEVDPIEAISTLKMLSGNDVATTLAQLLTSLASGQQAVKSAQTTPPVTA